LAIWPRFARIHISSLNSAESLYTTIIKRSLRAAGDNNALMNMGCLRCRMKPSDKRCAMAKSLAPFAPHLKVAVNYAAAKLMIFL
jgi:hypothetical protein